MNEESLFHTYHEYVHTRHVHMHTPTCMETHVHMHIRTHTHTNTCRNFRKMKRMESQTYRQVHVSTCTAGSEHIKYTHIHTLCICDKEVRIDFHTYSEFEPEQGLVESLIHSSGSVKCCP